MMTGKISDLVNSIENAMKETSRLIILREQRRADPNYKGCEFCFDTGLGGTGMETLPCPEHNGMCL
jgi:hypothetical protein